MDGQVNLLAWLTSFQNPFMDTVAGILDFMGEETFYLLVVPIIYWSISKKIGYRLSNIMMASLYINSLFKFYIPVKRPIGAEGVHSIRVETVQDSALYPYDSFTSGHAQGSFTLWTYLAHLVKKPWFWIVSIAIALFISYSRLYAGLHWPSDVISGIVVGLLITVIGIKVTPYFERLQPGMKWGITVIIPIILFFITPSTDAVKIAGFLLGSGIGYRLESNYVRMRLKTLLWKKVVAYIIGVAGAVLIKAVLKSVFPEALLFDFIRYSVMGLWVFFAAPLLFVKMRLYQDDKTPLLNDKGITM